MLTIVGHFRAYAKRVQLPRVISQRDGVGVDDLPTLHVNQDPPDLLSALAARGRQRSGSQDDEQQGSHYNRR